ncbi:hypothetical protein ABH924_003596 [Arthrobacter sp. GAS37]
MTEPVDSPNRARAAKAAKIERMSMRTAHVGAAMVGEVAVLAYFASPSASAIPLGGQGN